MEQGSVSVLLYTYPVAEVSEPQKEGVMGVLQARYGQLSPHLVTAASQHFGKTTHMLLVSAAAAPADF